MIVAALTPECPTSYMLNADMLGGAIAQGLKDCEIKGVTKDCDIIVHHDRGQVLRRPSGHYKVTIDYFDPHVAKINREGGLAY